MIAAAQPRSNWFSGTQPVVRTFGGRSAGAADSPIASTNSASSPVAAASTRAMPAANRSGPPSVPKVTAIRGRATGSRSHSGRTPPPLYGTYRMEISAGPPSTRLGGAMSTVRMPSGTVTPCRRIATAPGSSRSRSGVNRASPRLCAPAGTFSRAATTGPTAKIGSYTTRSG